MIRSSKQKDIVIANFIVLYGNCEILRKLEKATFTNKNFAYFLGLLTYMYF